MRTTLAKLLEIAKKEKKSLYIVGGFVRDSLAGIESRDVDIIVSEEADQFGKRVSGRLGADYMQLDSVLQLSRVSLIADDARYLQLDFSLLTGGDIEEDLKARDFTINAMAVRLEDYLEQDEWETKLIDPCGGREDLRAGLLRLTSEKCLTDDPVRLVRPARFIIKLGLKMDEKSREAIRRNAHGISKSYKMKTGIEIFLLLGIRGTARGMRILHEELSVLGEIYPPLSVMSQVRGRDGRDLLTHGLRTCEQLEKILDGDTGLQSSIISKLHAHLDGIIEEKRTRLAYLKLACIIHDIGKLDTPTAEEKRASFSHELAGEAYVENLAGMLKLTEHEQYFLARLVRNHARALYLKKGGSASRLRFFQQFKDMVPELLLLKAANLACHGRDCADWLEVLLDEYFSGIHNELPEPVVSANEVMEFFGLPPTRDLGSLIEEAYAGQLSGKVKSKGDALSLISRLLENRGRR
jgi:poly(A) polymerase